MKRKLKTYILFTVMFFALHLAQAVEMPNLPVQSANLNTTVITLLILGALLVYWIAWHNNPLFIRNKAQIVLHNKERGSFYSATMRSQVVSYSLFMAGYSISMAIFINHLAYHFFSFALPHFIWFVLCIVLLYHAVKYVLFSGIIRYLFLEKGAHITTIQNYLFLNIVLGLLLLPINIMMAYANHPTTIHIASIAGLIFIGLYFITLSVRLFYIFFKELSSLFYLILYLCTLEILPIWVPLQIAIKSLITNE